MIKNHLSAVMGAHRDSIRGLSLKIGLSIPTISAIYNERVSGIRFDTLDRLCRFYNCEVGDLLQFIDEPAEVNK